VKRTCPKGEEGQRWKRGGDCKTEVAPGVSLDGVRRSEKAEVPEKTGAETSAGCEASKKGKKRGKHTHTHTMHCMQLRLTYPPRWRGY
jgi:hypothetical protein